MASRQVDLRPPIGAEPGLPLTSQITASGTFTELAANNESPNVAKLLLNTQPPRLNFEMGWLETSQVRVSSKGGSLHSSSNATNSVSGTFMTTSEPGRFAAHKRRSVTTAQPGNFTFTDLRDSVEIPAHDTSLLSSSIHESGLGKSLNIVHYSATDLPSNGMGIDYNSAHNGAYSVQLFSGGLQASPGSLQLTAHANYQNLEDSQYWGVNLGVRQTVLASGVSLSAPPNTPSAADNTNILTDFSTIQTPLVRDDSNLKTIGSVHKGNHVVADSCGLLGYEGVMVATAFFNIPDNTYGGTDVKTFAGLNIQVHSGQSLVRNGRWYADSSLASTARYYYSDDTAIMPIQEALATKGIRKNSGESVESNQTLFHIGKNVNTDGDELQVQSGTNNGRAYSSAKADGNIFGDVTSTGNWKKTSAISTTFLADKVPTRVRIVPSLVSYETVTVGSTTFRKPIVDYHVLISVVETPKSIVQGSSEDYETRNDPTYASNFINADYSEDSVLIYHGIFRINPNELSEVKLGTTLQSNMVVPKDWGLHQLTPFRPLANPNWARIPKLCGTIESGGFYQRGGVSHLWDADAYGGELLVAADAIDASDFNSSVWGNGQVWLDGDKTGAADPRGSELLIFRWTPTNDDLYEAGKTTPTSNPLYTLTNGQTDSGSLRTGISISNYLYQWVVHDWVFPQVELMRYLGQERKDRARHPDHTSYAAALLHPTLHCSSFRIMEDGKMMMAAIHRDMISADTEYPAADITAWPFNPDMFSNPCPPGYYYNGTACVKIVDEQSDPVSGTGGAVFADPTPHDSNPDQSFGGSNFGRAPTWATLKASSSARSLILLWSDIKAVNGKVKAGKAKFEITYSTIDGSEKGTQNWVEEDTWWSGSRIAYWYEESAQRAIPITYGSYPEARCSHVVLPKSLPHLLSGGDILHGYPYRTTLDRSFAKADFTTRLSSCDTWMTDRREHLIKTRFVPTTVGFADFAAGASPHGDVGWSGWSFPASLYNAKNYTNSNEYDESGGVATAPFRTLLSGHLSVFQNGPMCGFSHFGPLHYGLSTNTHPYRTDRVWKQVHAGLGYDIPLHLLAPGKVQVRARAGGNASLDLELETPFSRTDKIHLEGATDLLTGFDQAGDGGTLGQYYLSTNLWRDDQRRTTNSGNVLYNDILLDDELIGGPFVSGNSLSAFWTNHPTDHFHAGAIPSMVGTDYDWDKVYSDGSPHVTLARAQELSKKDWVAVSEQLKSSVEVHVSKATRPYWDSGSMVTARGSPLASSYTISNRGESSGTTAANEKEVFGKGQRVLRTPDGTLHNFTLGPSLQSGAANQPTWIHYTKPVGSDLFWNRHSEIQQAAGTADTTPGKDEVMLLIDSGNPSVLDTNDKIYGAAFASDSVGTIHAVLDIQRDDNNSISGVPNRRLFYTYATRTVEATSPDPVYSWDWSVVTPVAINDFNGLATAKSSLQCPSLVCDSKDRLHLAARHEYTNGDSSIVYMMKTPEGNWPTIPETATSSWDNSQLVVIDSAGNAHDLPKLCLRSDDAPYVFYRREDDGSDAHVFCAEGSKAGAEAYTFTTKRVSWDNHAAKYYDAIIDEDDRGYVVCIMDNYHATINALDTRKSIPTPATTGAGNFKHLFVPASGSPYSFSDVTMTTNGEGEVHIVFRWKPSDADFTGTVPTPEDDGPYPLKWPGLPGGTTPTYGDASGAWSDRSHFLEVWMPSFEFDTDSGESENVIRSMNVRWLSVPSIGYNGTTSKWDIFGAAETLAGSEDFTHDCPQLRYQRYWGHNAADLDLTWMTNPLAWYRTPHAGAQLYWAWAGSPLSKPGDQDDTAPSSNIYGL